MTFPAPVVFGSAARQRLLCILATRGPQPSRLALRIARAQWREPLSSLERAGLVVRAGPPTNHVIAISDLFPGRAALVRLLRHLGTHYELPEPAARVSSAQFPGLKQSSARATTTDKMLGWPDRLYVFLALEALGGRSDLPELNAALPKVAGDVIRHNLAKFTSRGILNRLGSDKAWKVQFSATSCCVPHLRTLLRGLLRSFPFVRTAARKARRDFASRKPRAAIENINWRHAFELLPSPRTYSPPASGAPLMFGTDARFRVLTALAHFGPLTALDLRTCAGKPHERVMNGLISDKLIVDQGTRGARTFSLHPGFPAQTELRALLRRFWMMYPGTTNWCAPRPWRRSPILPWAGDPERLFGTKTRTLPLFHIAVLSTVDAASLCRLAPQHDRGRLRMALDMYKHYGILTTNREGTAQMYSLDTGYGAYRELSSLLQKIINLWPQYATAASLEEPLMSARRLSMRRNARIRARTSRAN